MDVVATVGSDEQASAAVQPGEGAFDDPAVAAKSGAVLAVAAGDHGFDASLPDLATVFVVVVAAVGDHAVGPLAGTSGEAGDRGDTVEQWQ